MALKQNISLCLFMMLFISSYAQDEINETSIWSNLHITNNLSNNLSAKVKVSYYSTMPLFSPRFIDAGLKYSFKNSLSFGFYYRFKGTFGTSCQRMYFETAYKNIEIKSLQLKISPRLRVQHKLTHDIETNPKRAFKIRPRLMLKRKLTSISTLYSSTETFYETNPERSLDFMRLRFDLGLNYKVPNTKHQVRIYYRYQMDKEEDNINTLSMMNIGYRFIF